MSGYNVTPPQPRPARSRPPLGSPVSAPPLNRATSSSARPYQDAIVSELCTLDTFQNDFNTNDFIAQLTSKLVQRSKADPGPFNPRPFIRTFEAALDQLVQIRSQVDAQSQQLSSSVHVAESAYAKKLDELSKNFVAVGNSFTSLEDRISEVGRTAIRIGEQLETIDKQRNRASEAHDLIEFYYMFARGDTSKLERLRKEGGREGRMKTAVIARRLAAISREVDVAGSEQTRESIDRYCERFERDMLKLFDKFYRRSDPKMMSHIAKVLQGFNGGASCVQIYVNQHDFFISKDRVGEANGIELSQIWTHMADPDHAPPRSEPSLSALFNEIRQTVEIEAQIISAVFPSPLVVMQTFLQRVFAQSVQGFVEVIMDKAMQINAPAFVGAGGTIDSKTAALELNPASSSQPMTSQLAFLRALHMARSSALSLVNDLKLYDYRGAGIVGPSNSAGADGANGSTGVQGDGSGSLTLLGNDAVAAAGHLAGASASPLAAMLDQSVEELFVPYMEGIRYIDRESRSLADLYAGLLSKFITFHRTAATAKRDKAAGNTIFNRMRNQITATSDASSSTSNFGGSSTATHASTAASSTASTSKTSFFKLSNLADRVRGTHSTAATNNNLAVGAPNAMPISAESSVDGHHVAGGAHMEDEIDDMDGDLSLDMAEKMLRWHAESIGRCVDLSSPSEVPKATFALLRVLTSAYIKTYVETALDSALAAATAQDIRGTTVPDPCAAMALVRSVELILSLWQHYVNTALLPLASTSVTSRREMMIFNNHNLLRVEGKCDALMQKVADNIVGFLANRLATQKKNDFTPKNDDLAFARQNTEPCVACSEALEKVQQAARANLSLSSSRMLTSTSGTINVRGSPKTAQRPGSSRAIRGAASMDGSEGAGARVSWADADANGDAGGDDDDDDDEQHRRSHLSRNAETFLTEIGVAFHGLLLDHLRKYTVSAAGGIMLTKDLAMYQDAIGTFNIPVLSDRFDMLRQLGNLFIVQASVLKSYMREGHLAKIDERLLRPYLLRRADYAKEVRDLDAGPAPTTPTAATATQHNPFGMGADVFATAPGGGRDLFAHLPGLINGSSGSPAGGATSSSAAGASAGGKSPEELRLQRLGDVLAHLEKFGLAASGAPQQAKEQK
ncbi:related to exocyst complex 100 kDa component [Sporisorium reilianum SRZ2]|uniref:Related to exocyst complex 100 kDa component n=1 Tax=Sporisorium reilianum (strain SRZ2) TaxID=999809 RepID=E6ZK77_SPORE|nr:related to exocyst complex 100 kDa component [Sporisorium reilianum SRZ2]